MKLEDTSFKEFEKLNKSIIGTTGLVCVIGSVAYGTNLPGKSDLDLRGWSYGTLSSILGTDGDFEQKEDKVNDIVIYSFSKYLKLLMSNNPNSMESLGLNSEHYLYKSDVMDEIIKNQSKFITSKIFYTIGGYARQQLARLQSINRKDDFLQSTIIDTTHNILLDRYNRDIIVKVTNKEDQWHEFGDLRAEVISDLSGLDSKELGEVTGRMTTLVNNYTNLNSRNKKIDELHMNKHAMHIIRLLIMGEDILRTGEVHTYREKEHDLLMSIRFGEFQESNGLYGEKFDKLVELCDKKFNDAKFISKLRDTPDLDWINNFKIEVLGNKILEIWRGRI